MTIYSSWLLKERPQHLRQGFLCLFSIWKDKDNKEIIRERESFGRGEIDLKLEPVPISMESYENDTWVPLIYEIRTKGIELKAA